MPMVPALVCTGSPTSGEKAKQDRGSMDVLVVVFPRGVLRWPGGKAMEKQHSCLKCEQVARTGSDGWLASVPGKENGGGGGLKGRGWANI